MVMPVAERGGIVHPVLRSGLWVLLLWEKRKGRGLPTGRPSEVCCLGRLGSSANRGGQALKRQKALAVPFKFGV